MPPMTAESTTDANRRSFERLVRPELRFKSATNEWPTPDSPWPNASSQRSMPGASDASKGDAE